MIPECTKDNLIYCIRQALESGEYEADAGVSVIAKYDDNGETCFVIMPTTSVDIGLLSDIYVVKTESGTLKEALYKYKTKSSTSLLTLAYSDSSIYSQLEKMVEEEVPVYKEIRDIIDLFNQIRDIIETFEALEEPIFTFRGGVADLKADILRVMSIYGSMYSPPGSDYPFVYSMITAVIEACESLSSTLEFIHVMYSKGEDTTFRDLSKLLYSYSKHLREERDTTYKM